MPAQAKPSAMAAPHRTYGLYDSANKLTTEGNCSGVLKIKPKSFFFFTITS